MYDFSQIVRAECTIYVTFLPGSDFVDTLNTVRRLKTEGFNPVPHFAARSIVSAEILEKNLQALQNEGITEALLIGGGVDQKDSGHQISSASTASPESSVRLTMS